MPFLSGGPSVSFVAWRGLGILVPICVFIAAFLFGFHESVLPSSRSAVSNRLAIDRDHYVMEVKGEGDTFSVPGASSGMAKLRPSNGGPLTNSLISVSSGGGSEAQGLLSPPGGVDFGPKKGAKKKAAEPDPDPEPEVRTFKCAGSETGCINEDTGLCIAGPAKGLLEGKGEVAIPDWTTAEVSSPTTAKVSPVKGVTVLPSTLLPAATNKFQYLSKMAGELDYWGRTWEKLFNLLSDDGPAIDSVMLAAKGSTVLWFIVSRPTETEAANLIQSLKELNPKPKDENPLKLDENEFYNWMQHVQKQIDEFNQIAMKAGSGKWIRRRNQEPFWDPIIDLDCQSKFFEGVHLADAKAFMQSWSAGLLAQEDFVLLVLKKMMGYFRRV